MASDFDDLDTEGARAGRGGTRLHAMISVGGAVTSKLLPATGELTIGRSSSCDVVIQHATVSRHHATLKLSTLEVIDAGSRNGTRIRGKTLNEGEPSTVAIGEAFQIGDVAILLQEVSLSFDGKPMLEPWQLADGSSPPHSVDAECARSARSGSPFALLLLHTDDGRPKELQGLLRAFMRTTDVVTADGAGGFQVLLVDTDGAQASVAVSRLTKMLQQHGITAQIGMARYPVDGVVAEQLIAHAYEQLARDSDEPTAMDTIRDLVRQIATGDLSVLISGETGVGKELCAEMIHRMSQRASRPFVKLNCSALVESLIESELFGHERGAFTGATSAHPGLLETGNGGTVFLDEIGEMPLGVQAKLLRVLEERVVRRVGATVGKKVDVRFIFATNRDLANDVNAGRFRRDLYYRINGMTIAIPPLRERRGEIIALARAFANRARAGSSIVFGNEVIAALEGHTWPGNIRELRNTIERAVLLSSGGTIRPAHLVLEAVRETTTIVGPRESQPTMPPIDRSSYETLERPAIRSSTQSLAREVADLERQRILEALEQCGGNQSRAAKLLGISRNTLLSRLDAYGLPRPRKP